MHAFWKRFFDFLFPYASDNWLAVLRIGLGLQIVLYSLSLREDWNFIFSQAEGGLITRDLAEAMLPVESSGVPRLSWLVEAGGRVGLGESTVLSLAWIVLFLAGCSLLVGFFSRPSAIVAWFLHVCAVKSGGLISYGMDNLTTIGLFYLMLSPLPDRYSLDRRVRKLAPRRADLNGFFRRVIQLHLCVIYFFGGISKCLGIGWWNGTSMWRALIRPPFNVISPELIISWKFVLPAIGIAVWVSEAGYPFFIWSRKTRFLWLAAILVLHIGIGVAMGLYLFALIMIVLNLAAFGVSAGQESLSPDRSSVADIPLDRR